MLEAIVSGFVGIVGWAIEFILDVVRWLLGLIGVVV